MSVAVRRALYGKLAGDSTLNGLLATAPDNFSKSIYYQLAPSGAHPPYVIFNQQAGSPIYAMDSTNQIDDELWQIKGIEPSTPPNFSADRVDAIATRLDDLLTDGTISISGKTQRYLRRETDVSYSETLDGVLWRHAGALYRLMYV